MKILITGSAGYIGSCLFEYLKKKHKIYGTDKIIPKIKKQKNFFLCNLLDFNKINNIIKTINPDIVIHLAAQSTLDFIDKKKEYIKNNTYVTKNIVKSMHKNKIKHLIFSSTAAVYKNSNKILTEKSQLSPNNIYGKTKLDCEKLIIDNTNKDNKINFIIFRFFNVCSSLFSLKIGEMHNPETHLIPILSSKFRENKKVFIYGNDFKTKDKTCIRDYIHIEDIVKAFGLGIQYFSKNKKSEIINLGTKKGFSTLSIFKTFQNFYNYKYKKPFFKRRRKGDVDQLICDNKKSYQILKWTPRSSVISKIIDDEKKWVNFFTKKKLIRKTVY